MGKGCGIVESLSEFTLFILQDEVFQDEKLPGSFDIIPTHGQPGGFFMIAANGTCLIVTFFLEMTS